MDSTLNQPSAVEMLVDLLATDQEIAPFLDDLSRLAAIELTKDLPVLCGITLERHKRLTIVGSSDDEARKLDEIQLGFEEGPCLHSQKTHTLIRVDDVESETRWPDYMAAVRGHGLRSVLAVPLDLEDVAKAAMNFYTTAPGAFNDSMIEAAERYAALAARALRVAVRIARHAEAAEDRQRAMESRTVIDIAIGITMAQAQCSQDEAFQILKKASSHRNIKLHALAEELVATVGQSAPMTVFEN